MFSKKTAIVCAAAAALGLSGITSVVQAAPLNTTALANIEVTNTTDSTTIYKIDIPNGTNVISSSYIQDPGNTAQYVGNGYGDGSGTGVDSGTITVQDYTDSQSVTHARSIVMSTAETAPPDGGAPLYFDTGPNPLATANTARVSFALDMVTNGGITNNAFNNAAFAANIFANAASATRFIASPTSSTGGVFGLTKSDGTLFTVGNYTNGTFYNIDVNLDFLSQTATLSIDGVESSSIGFRNTFASTPDITEVFFYQGASVPEPSSLALVLGVGGLALLSRRPRRRKIA